MASIGTEIELGEFLLILVAIGIGASYLKKTFSSASDAFNNALNQSGLGDATITNKGQPSFAGPQRVTAAQARSLAIVSGHDQTDWTISPDGTQVWFGDGSYYDNPTGKFYPAPGGTAATSIDVTDPGAVLGWAAGSTAGAVAGQGVVDAAFGGS